MRYLFLILFFAAAIRSSAQNDTSAVLAAVHNLEKALVSKDTATLIPLLHKDVAYGHSSGWVQTKKAVVDDLLSGFMIYNKIDNSATTINAGKEKAIVQERIAVSGARDGQTFDLKLFVMEVWLLNKKGWQLYSRQSTKL